MLVCLFRELCVSLRPLSFAPKARPEGFEIAFLFILGIIGNRPLDHPLPPPGRVTVILAAINPNIFYN